MSRYHDCCAVSVQDVAEAIAAKYADGWEPTPEMVVEFVERYAYWIERGEL